MYPGTYNHQSGHYQLYRNYPSVFHKTGMLICFVQNLNILLMGKILMVLGILGIATTNDGSWHMW